jgi:hypothetical protein
MLVRTKLEIRQEIQQPAIAARIDRTFVQKWLLCCIRGSVVEAGTRVDGGQESLSRFATS